MNKLEEALKNFYEEYEDSYIDANTHNVIKILIEELQVEELLPRDNINWDNL